MALTPLLNVAQLIPIHIIAAFVAGRLGCAAWQDKVASVDDEIDLWACIALDRGFYFTAGQSNAPGAVW